MATIHQIKVLQAQGYRVSAIAETLGVDRKTVRKYLAQSDFSPGVPVKRARASKLDPYKATIDLWLEEDTSRTPRLMQLPGTRSRHPFELAYPTSISAIDTFHGIRVPPFPERWIYNRAPQARADDGRRSPSERNPDRRRQFF